MPVHVQMGGDDISPNVCNPAWENGEWSTPYCGRFIPRKYLVTVQKAGWALEPVWTTRKSRTGSTDRPAHRELLYRLRYHGRCLMCVYRKWSTTKHNYLLKTKCSFWKRSYVYSFKKFVLLINSYVLLLFFVYTVTFFSPSNKCPGCRWHDYSISNSSPIIIGKNNYQWQSSF